MTAEQALRKALTEIHREDAEYIAASNGIFLVQAPSSTTLPYSTYAITSAIPERTMRTTSGWTFKVQIKHWAQDAIGVAPTDRVQQLKDRSGYLLHAQDSHDYGRGADEVLDAMNALSGLNGWKFIHAEIVNGFGPYLDSIGDKQVWCGGHTFEFWLEYAA